MTISEELRAKILRYHYVEQWPIGTISSQLHVHHSTIKRVLSETGVSKKELLVQGSIIEPFLSFILDKLQQHPTLTAKRLYHMVKERGYPGGSDHFRHLISLYRPRRPAEAFLRLKTLPGEQGQVDWASFGTMTIGKAKRPLVAFVMILSYSRRIYLQFYLSQRMENFLRGHEGAFLAFNGLPRVLQYDNLRSAVLERQGKIIRFNLTLLSFAAHYRFEPKPVAVGRGNEKGRVERAIQFIRTNFFAARTYNDIDDLNAQAKIWCETLAMDRPCPEEKTKTVRAVFEEEQPRLLALPNNPYPCDEIETVTVGKTPYVRFDLNDYSVPPTEVQKCLTIHASLDTVTILDRQKILVIHKRCYGKSEQIEVPEHIKALVKQKQEASHHRGQHYLSHAVPCANDFLKQAAVRGYVLKTITKQLMELLDDYGIEDLKEAMQIALNKGSPHPNTVRWHLQILRDKRGQQTVIPSSFASAPKIQETRMKPNRLHDYGVLTQKNLQEEDKS
jgi:transposase